ncbi:putative elicitor protein [Diaporthe ampelina]|uniref:Putative elicitor protein n=1 Tax=Diaporthe ampelina TaxID=1214573 RepID=A0A0G2FXT5_9PEZI|nr:putative elicitor protein [Diaporthe ampelina]
MMVKIMVDSCDTAFRDGGAGSGANRRKPTDEAPRGGARGGRGARGRGGRGATHHRNADDRHTKNIVPGSEKQAAQSWGAAEGTAELNDEQAGEAIAQTEQKDAEAEDAEAEAQEPEPKQVTLEAYLAEQAEKKAALNVGTSTRKPNEGVNSKQEKKWADAKALVKDDSEDFIAGSGGKKLRERERKQKVHVDIDGRWQEQPADRTREARGGRGGRGGDRGGRGGERGDRRGGAPRGAPRGGAPRGGDGFPRGGPRGGRGGSATINPNDTSAFPSLGGK